MAFVIPIIHGILELRKKEAATKSDQEYKEEKEVESDYDETSFTEENSDVEGDLRSCVKVIDNVKFDFEESNSKSHSGNKLRALIITPTRELAVQVSRKIFVEYFIIYLQYLSIP